MNTIQSTPKSSDQPVEATITKTSVEVLELFAEELPTQHDLKSSSTFGSAGTVSSTGGGSTFGTISTLSSL